VPFTARIERYICSLQACSCFLWGWGLIDLLLRAAFSPAHPLARRDVPLARARAFRFCHFGLEGNSQTVLHCAHRTPLLSDDPSKLACLSYLGMAPVLVPLRPSNEHILIVRVPGARDQRGCHSLPFCLTASRPFVTLRADWRHSPNKTEIS